MSEEVLSATHFPIVYIFAVAEWLEKNRRVLKSYDKKIIEVTENELKQISGLTTPNKVLMVLETIFDFRFSIFDSMVENPKSKIQNPKSKIVLYLDGIQDPGNMGTIWRIADWFGIEYLFCSDTCVDVWNPKVIQSCMGAFLRVASCEINFSDLQKTFPTYPIYGAVLDGENIFELKNPVTPGGIIVIGNEGNGISNEILSQIHHKISIPKAGKAESLNAAVAAGIICAALINSR